ncbi:ABC transporter G family member 20-like [Bacillus rossius redtenbacheri]|uniref:ABC transporter G family member 20-like n=1 Tax=Bacillus rossius redtenbacheri TaxID=93214 RepID=UPI002FDCD260
MERQATVRLAHAHKQYGAVQVLRDLSMAVQQGTIYGLLGASGCGKTTLLSCIVGRLQLDSGHIQVLGGQPGSKYSGVPGTRVGYMPQETALFPELSIRETMLYFGWICDMSTPQVEDRLEFLLHFLDLPDADRVVKKLSGGQKRRVSLAAALLHDPELLILDEPTVGLDPLLRHSIWQHLVELAKTGSKTIIITTHYIEEARNTSTIGLMRNGKLLAEDTPDALLARHGRATLEEVFLQLSERQEQENLLSIANDARNRKPETVSGDLQPVNSELSPHHGVEDHITSKDGEPRRPKDCCGLVSVGAMRALMKKNYLYIWRNPGMMMFIFGVPVFQVILFCLAVGGDPWDLPLAIVNHDADCNFAVPAPHNCSYDELSCRYLTHLTPPTIVKEYYGSLGAAQRAVRRGRAWGLLHLAENFTSGLVERVNQGEHVSDELLNQGAVHVALDMSNQQIGQMLQSKLRTAYQQFAEELFRACNISSKIAQVPVRFEEPVYGDRSPSFLNYCAPGLILVLIFFLGVALSIGTMVHERRERLLDRTLVAGVTSFEIMLSFVLIQLVVMCCQVVLLLGFALFVFRVECVGDMGWISLLTVLQGMSGVCFGFTIAAFCQTESTAFQVAMGSFYPSILLGGTIWPLEGMHMLLMYVSKCMPLTLPIQALRCLMSRGWGLGEPDVYLGFVSGTAWTMLFLATTILAVKVKKL